MPKGNRGVQRALPLGKQVLVELTPKAEVELVEALAELLLAAARSEVAHHQATAESEDAHEHEDFG